MPEIFSVKRAAFLLGAFLVSMIAVLFLFTRKEHLYEEMVCGLITVIIAGILFTAHVTGERIRGKNGIYSGTSYGEFFLAVLLQWALVVLMAYLPEYVNFFPVIPFLLLPFCGEGLTIGFGILDTVVLSIAMERSIYSVFESLAFICIGTYLFYLYIQMKQEQHKGSMKRDFLFFFLFLFASDYAVTAVFSGLILRAAAAAFVPEKSLLLALPVSLVCFVLAFFLTKRRNREEAHQYEFILDQDYPLYRMIREYSIPEYQHAETVSALSRRAAEACHLHAGACEAGGRYYRLARMFGDTDCRKTLRLLENRCFPPAVTAIVYEYGGLLRKPGTPESAVVSMVDAVVTRLEKMDRDTMSLSWNQDMLVYQTLNELSQSGIYDASGLSMNQYLAVRNILLNEELMK